MAKPAKPTNKTNAAGTKKESIVKAAIQSASKVSASLRIVGIGASAGGLETLEHFFCECTERQWNRFEELQAVNVELQSKADDLAWVNSDMKNLLNSTEIATVFLDDKLNVRRFTTHTTQFFKLIVGDVGQPLSDIVTDLRYAELQDEAMNVPRTLVFVEKQISTNDGCWYKGTRRGSCPAERRKMSLMAL